MVYTTGDAGRIVHSHWTSLDNTQRDYRNISLAVKLWRPEEWHRVRLYLALSVLAVPSSRSQIQEWQTGVELTLSNTKSGIVAGGKVCHCQRCLCNERGRCPQVTTDRPTYDDSSSVTVRPKRTVMRVVVLWSFLQLRNMEKK
jgi:hypothetical protein